MNRRHAGESGAREFNFSSAEKDWLEDLDVETDKVIAEELRTLEEHYSEDIRRTYDDWNNVWSNEKERDKVLESVHVTEILHRLGVEDVEIRDGYYTFSHASKVVPQDLPAGYACKGGAARSALARRLGIDPFVTPRDIDIIRLADENNDASQDWTVAEQYMPDDVAHGHGVEVVGSIGEYLQSRDLTVNEVLATHDTIVASAQCIRDTARGVLRVTQHEKEKYHGKPGPKMLTKVMRLYAEAINRGNRLVVPDDEVATYTRKSFLSPFWIALNLDRAYQTGGNAPLRLFEVLRAGGHVPSEVDSLEDMILHLEELFMGYYFYFQHAPVEQLLRIQEQVEEDEMQDRMEDLGGGYEDLPKQESMRPRK